MTAQQVIKIAAEEIGYTESPANSNRTKYGSWYGMDGQPWCMMFVQWCFTQAGVPLPYRTASCSALERWYRQNNPEAVHASPAPGDVAIYNFGHTGIVERVEADGRITAIEGNTSPSEAGSQNNGGGVYRKTRNTGSVTAFLRPDYESEEDDMDLEGFKQLWMAMRKELQDDDAGEWSQQAREWATSSGIIQGDQSYMWEDLLTREQMAVIMYRFAKLIGKA